MNLTGGAIRLLLLGAALSVGVVIASGCSTPWQRAAASPSSDPRAAGLKFSQCMREHGVTDFPDPSSNGGISLQGNGSSDLDPNSSTFQAAQAACQKYLSGSGPTGTANPEMQKKMLEFARCMRAHGVTDFPDPSSNNGGVSINGNGSSDLDPNNPTFQSGFNACKSILGSGPGAPQTSTGGS